MSGAYGVASPVYGSLLYPCWRVAWHRPIILFRHVTQIYSRDTKLRNPGVFLRIGSHFTSLLASWCSRRRLLATYPAAATRRSEGGIGICRGTERATARRFAQAVSLGDASDPRDPGVSSSGPALEALLHVAPGNRNADELVTRGAGTDTPAIWHRRSHPAAGLSRCATVVNRTESLGITTKIKRPEL